MQYDPISEDVLEMVMAEAKRAHENHGRQSMLYGRDDKSLRIALEEVGEVAREMNELALEHITAEEYHERILGELIQCAAMFVTWAEKKAQTVARLRELKERWESDPCGTI